MIFDSWHFWHALTRLGEAQILLPAALLTAGKLLRHATTRALAWWWMTMLAVTVIATTATKVAFLGWGLGVPAWDFTGVSGHTMLSTAIYPLLFAALTLGRSQRVRVLALLFGVALALLVGMSRVEVAAHTYSEVIAGWLLGGTVNLAALALLRAPRQPVGALIPTALAIWLLVMPAHAPAAQTHSMVTRLALSLSGHQRPYTRADMLREWRQRAKPLHGTAIQWPKASTRLRPLALAR
jgi:membrane-associated phospholipid phosphatase